MDAYYERKDYAAIVSLFSDAGITDGTDAETILRMAESLGKSGDTRKAIALLESALNSRPEDGPLYLALAGYYQQIGNSQKANELTRKGKTHMEPGTAPSSP